LFVIICIKTCFLIDFINFSQNSTTNTFKFHTTILKPYLKINEKRNVFFFRKIIYFNLLSLVVLLN
jgi:hypothetical protein